MEVLGLHGVTHTLKRFPYPTIERLLLIPGLSLKGVLSGSAVVSTWDSVLMIDPPSTGLIANSIIMTLYYIMRLYSTTFLQLSLLL